MREFRTVDYMNQAADAIVDVAGRGEIQFEAPRPGFQYRIERIVTSLSVGSATSCIFYVGELDDAAGIVEQTDAPVLNVADETNPILVTEGLPFRAVVLGATVGARFTVRIQYALVLCSYSKAERIAAPMLVPPAPSLPQVTEDAPPAARPERLEPLGV